LSEESEEREGGEGSGLAEGTARRMPAAPDRPGLKGAVQTARVLSHVFLVLGFFGLLIGFGSRGPEGAILAFLSVGGFLLCYFAWVGLVLFGYMNFSLSAMLGFVFGLGACVGLLMSREDALIFIGGLGLFVLVLVTVIPVSQYDPTTERRERRERKAGAFYPSDASSQ